LSHQNANFVRGARSKADHIYGTDTNIMESYGGMGPDLFWDNDFMMDLDNLDSQNNRAPSEEGSRSERKMEIEEDESEVNSR
jgi:hypothetical protein